MRDSNPEIVSGKVADVVGHHGLVDKNDRGDRLIRFSQLKKMVTTNTKVKLPPRRLDTWSSIRNSKYNIVRNQIDYILIHKKIRIQVLKHIPTQTNRTNSDHNPVVAKIELKLKVVKKTNYKAKPTRS